MKKRKIKLFASVASLAMVAAVMGVGVWAATQQSVAISSEVSFAATGLVGSLTLGVTGESVAAATAETSNANVTTKTNLDVKTEAKEIAKFVITDAQDTATTVSVALDLKDVKGATPNGPDGFYSAADGTITYTFTFTNGNAAQGGAAISMIATATENTNWDVLDTSELQAESIAAGANGSVTVVFQYQGENAVALEAGAHDLPQITLAFNTIFA